MILFDTVFMLTMMNFTDFVKHDPAFYSISRQMKDRAVYVKNKKDEARIAREREDEPHRPGDTAASVDRLGTGGCLRLAACSLRLAPCSVLLAPCSLLVYLLLLAFPAVNSHQFANSQQHPPAHTAASPGMSPRKRSNSMVAGQLHERLFDERKGNPPMMR